MRPLRTAVFILALAAVGADASASEQVPGEREDFALVGGTVHTVSGDVIDGGTVIVRDGRIEAVGGDLDPDGLPTVDFAGKHVYPGLLDAATQIGLVEIGAVRASRDTNELGGVNPNAQAHVSVNPDSEIIPTTRANGVLLAHVHPGGGDLIAGQSAVMMMDGWTYEDMTLDAPTGMVMSWPNLLPRTAWWVEETVEEQMKQTAEQLQRIEELFDEAERYKLAREAAGLSTHATSRPAAVDPQPAGPAYDAKLEAMVPLLDGEVPAMIFADEASQIEATVAFAKRRGLKLVILGGGDAGKVADLLAAADVPVILDGTHRLPRGRDGDLDEAAKLPAILKEKGIAFAIAGNREPSFARNLPYHAAAAVPFGLTPDEAVASVTLWPAQILGVADRVGSLEAGKDATLFVADGDILEVPTHVTHAWIAGRRVDLSSRHTRLYEKYKRRHGQE